MKTKMLLSFLVLCLCLSTVKAQDYKFEMGITSGPSIRKFWGAEDIYNIHKAGAGFSAAMSFQYNIKKTLSLYTELGYERKGEHLTWAFLPDDVIYLDIRAPDIGITNVNFDYLTIPVLIKGQFGKKVKFIVDFGPSMSFLVKAQNVFIDSYSGDKRKSGYGDLLKHVDLGLSAGLGMAVPIKEKFAFNFEVRNNLGLMKENKPEFQNVNNGKTRTFSANLLVGFSYKFGKKSEE